MPLQLSEGDAVTHLGGLRSDDLVRFLNYVGIPLVAMYSFCMLIWPWIAGEGDWGHVLDVWDRWQSLNVGVLAFISSLTALNISRFNGEKQRERDFLAAKAFLPTALSGLNGYFKACAKVYIVGWDSEGGSNPSFDIPNLPDDYKSVFKECIKYAEPDVGDCLSRMLVRLQIHDSRMRNYVEHRLDSTYLNPNSYNLITYLYGLGELQAFLNKLFDFARNMKEFDSSKPQWEDFLNAYGNLDIWVDDYRIDDLINLQDFTKRSIEKNADKSE